MKRHKRILIIDNDPKVLLVLRTTLERIKNGFVIKTANDGKEALAKIQGMSFDLIISDVKMPFISGVEFVEIIRSMDMKMPVILITAYGCHSLRAEFNRLGIYRCLEKPLRIGEIRQATQEALQSNLDL